MVIKRKWKVISGTMAALVAAGPASALGVEDDDGFDLEDQEVIDETGNDDTAAWLLRLNDGEDVSLLSPLSDSGISLETFESFTESASLESQPSEPSFESASAQSASVESASPESASAESASVDSAD